MLSDDELYQRATVIISSALRNYLDRDLLVDRLSVDLGIPKAKALNILYDLLENV